MSIAPVATKPRLRKLEGGWYCYMPFGPFTQMGFGQTPQAAFQCALDSLFHEIEDQPDRESRR